MMFDMVLDTPLITVRIFIYLNACVKYAGSLVYFRSIKNKHEKDKKSAHAQNANLITINSMLKETLSANDSLREIFLNVYVLSSYTRILFYYEC